MENLQKILEIFPRMAYNDIHKKTLLFTKEDNDMKQLLKRSLPIIGVALLCICMLAACGKKSSTTTGDPNMTTGDPNVTTGDPNATEGEHVHAFGEWTESVAAGCLTDGERVRSCACGETEKETIAATGHKYEEKITREASCLTQGEKSFTCACGDSYSEQINALGHDYGDYVSDNNATCLADGTRSATCSRCGKKLTRADSGTALGHDFSKYISDNNATCEKDGTKTATCSRCGKTDTQTDAGTATGHIAGGDGKCKFCGIGLVPCTGIKLTDESMQQLNFTSLSQSAQLKVRLLPENTTDQLTPVFTSQNTAVVKVDENGLVTPVGAGEALIYITCGEYTLTVKVSVTPTLRLTSNDITLSPTNGTSYDLYRLLQDKELYDPAKLICTSADENYVRIEGTKAVAVKNCAAGVKVKIQYGDQSAECLVRVAGIRGDYYLSSRWTYGTAAEPNIEVTIEVGEQFELKLLSVIDGKAVSGLTWKPSEQFAEACTLTQTDEGIKITGKAPSADLGGGYVYIETTYEGVTYRCKIYVKPAA